jgi:CTP synthase
MYHSQGLDQVVLAAFGVTGAPKPDLKHWEEIADRLQNPDGAVKIAIVGKYTDLEDAYKSIAEAVTHAGIANRVRVKSEWIDSEIFEREDPTPYLDGFHGVLIPGGFGVRGTEGMINAVRWARERRVPFFGICLGMQMAVIETARNLAGIPQAGSAEWDDERREQGKAPQVGKPLIFFMPEWLEANRKVSRSENDDKGATMRLGAFQATVKPGAKAAAVYGTLTLSERHRHRYEVDSSYQKTLETAGLLVSATSPDGVLPEIVERRDHPWFIGVQFHPELKSRPFAPHPLFVGFISAALAQSRLV